MIIPFPGSGRSPRRAFSPAQVKAMVDGYALRIASQCRHPHPDFDLGMAAGIDHFFATVRPETIVTTVDVVTFMCENMDEQGHHHLMAFYTSMGVPTVDFAYRMGFVAGWMYAAGECGKLPGVVPLPRLSLVPGVSSEGRES